MNEEEGEALKEFEERVTAQWEVHQKRILCDLLLCERTGFRECHLTVKISAPTRTLEGDIYFSWGKKEDEERIS